MVSERGFTLVEVLVALMIVGLALPALLMRMESMANSTIYARDVMLAHWVAENRLQEIYLTQRMQGITPRGRQADDAEMAGRRWDWQVEAEATAVPGLFRFRVRVAPQGDEDLVELSGFVFDQG